MKIRLSGVMRPVFLCMAVCAPLFSAVPQTLPDALVKARTQYQDMLNELSRKRDDGIERLRAAYLEQLKNLLAASKDKGDLDGVLAAQNETERFERAREVAPGDVVFAPDALKTLQERFRQASTKIASDTNAEIVGLTDRYLGGLERYQRQAVQDNRVSDALTARQEMDAVRSDPRYLIASTLQTPECPEPAPPAAPSQDQPGQERSRHDSDWRERQREQQPAASKIYRKAEAPAVENLLEQPVHYTGMKSRATALRLPAKLYIYMDMTDEGGSRWRGAWASTRTSSGTYTYYPRIEFTPQANDNPENWTVVFEYFIRPLAESSRQTKARVELIKLSSQVKPGETWVVDGAGVQVRKFEHRSQHAGGGSRTYAQGHDYYGTIVSIYDADGQMVFQRTDNRQLGGQSSDTLPRALNDTPGAPYRVGGSPWENYSPPCD